MNSVEAGLYVRLNAYKRLIERTSAFIVDSLSKIEKPYVACSFGKDSAAMLHLVLQQKPDIPVRFVRWSGETEHIDNYDEVISQWTMIYPNLNLIQVELSRESINDKVLERFDTTGYDSFFIGLREQESTARRITLRTHGIFYKMASGLIRISPLAYWHENDVAAYVLSNYLPTLGKYLTEGFTSRTASRVPRADHGIRANFLQSLRQTNLSAYNNLLQNFPELASHG